MTIEDEKRVQVHVPYPILLERLGEVLAERINPEVYMDGAALENASASDLERIRRELAAAGLRITMHGPYMNVNPGSSNEETRLHTVDRYAKTFEAASVLRPVNIVLHAGYDAGRFRGGPAQWMEQSMKTWPRFVRRAEDLGVTIAAENIFETGPSTLKALVRELGSPNFRVCLDSGHLSVFSGVPLEEWFRELGPDIAEVHLHDNRGGADEHLPIGEGVIDFPLFFRLLERYASGPVYTIEPHGEEVMRRAIKAVRAYL
ncbi:MAG: sugar phosphate isomerase/epimerase family protein [Thermodesulfobacteriota bacterium]